MGMEDPNIIGDAGPTDVAPGGDPELPVLTEPLPPEEETPSEKLIPSDEAVPDGTMPDEVVGVAEFVVIDENQVLEVGEVVVFPADDER